jgi:hypothetical protein
VNHIDLGGGFDYLWRQAKKCAGRAANARGALEDSDLDAIGGIGRFSPA